MTPKRETRVFTFMNGLLLSAALLVGFFLTTSSYAADVYTLKFNWEIAAGKTQCTVWPYAPGGRFEKLVTQHTKGAVKLDIKEGLIGPTESLMAISDGRVDMGGQLTALASATYPLVDFGAMPGFITTGPGVGYEWAAALLDPRMKKIMEKYSRSKGFIILGASPALAANAIYGNKRIQTLADFKGTKIRGGGVILTKELEAFGAKAVSISTAEVEEALMRGTVDAVHTTLNFGQEHRFFEICKYINIWPFSQPYAMLIAINAKKFDSLPQEVQQGLRAAGEQITWEIASVCEQQVYTYNIWAESSKAEVVYADPEDVKKAAERMVPVIQFWLKMAGPEGAEVLRIAADYATGPAVSQVKALVK
jgi:TRAP-type C4-dicarboxylate transport system substrate-binding protein